MTLCSENENKWLGTVSRAVSMADRMTFYREVCFVWVDDLFGRVKELLGGPVV